MSWTLAEPFTKPKSVQASAQCHATATLKAQPTRAKDSAIVPPFTHSIRSRSLHFTCSFIRSGHPFRFASLLLPPSLLRTCYATLCKPLRSRSLPLIPHALLRTLRSQRLHASRRTFQRADQRRPAGSCRLRALVAEYGLALNDQGPERTNVTLWRITANAPAPPTAQNKAQAMPFSPPEPNPFSLRHLPLSACASAYSVEQGVSTRDRGKGRLHANPAQ